MASLACSVVIVSYYTRDALFECLAALCAENSDDFAVEIIVVDNGNSADVKQQLITLESEQRIRWLRGQGNIGFSAGCNLGVEQASSDTVLLLNPDCVAKDGAVKQLCGFLQRHCADNPRTLVSGWVTNPDGSEQRGLRRNLLTPWSLLIERLPILKQMTFLQPYRLNLIGQPFETSSVKACSGACMMMPTSLYRQLNGMDEGYFLHVDDLDLCRRLSTQGGRILIDETSVFSHYQGTSIAHQQRVAKHKRNGFLRYFAKHHRYFWYSPLGWGLRAIIHLNYWLTRR